MADEPQPAVPAPGPVPAAGPAEAGRPDTAPARPEAAEPAQPDRVLLHMPVDVRSASLAVIAVLACIFALRWAAAVFIPLMLSLMFTYALAPLVDRLENWHLPRWLGAAIVLLGLAGALGWTGYRLSDSASELLDALPAAAQKLRQVMRTKPTAAPSALDTVQKAATQIEQATQENAARVTTPRGVQRVVIERPGFNVRDYLVSGTLGLVTAVGQLTLIAFLTYFALCSGDTFRRKLVRMAPGWTEKKVTVKVLDDITAQIERYLLVQILTSAIVGLATGVAFWSLGLENAAVWGIVAAVTNLIPYVGSLIVMAASALVAFLQFNGIEMTLAVAGASLLIHTLVGNLLTPWLTSRTSRMNPVAVFVGVIFWGWLWGIWGLLLGVPVMMVIKAVCDRVEDLQPIGELLGD